MTCISRSLFTVVSAIVVIAVIPSLSRADGDTAGKGERVPASPTGGFVIRDSTADGGGATSAGGGFTLSGTIGQPDAGTMTGGGYGFFGGFWSPAPGPILGPPGVPGSGAGGGMRVAKLAPDGNTLLLTWDVATCGSSQHVLVHGGGSQLPAGLGGVYSLVGSACGLGGTGSYTWTNTINPANDPKKFAWWLILATDGATTEGSWGRDSAGAERRGPGPGGASLQCGLGAKVISNSCGQ